MSQYIKNQLAFSVSLFLHLFLWVIFNVSLNFSKVPPKIGDNFSPVINSYIQHHVLYHNLPEKIEKIEKIETISHPIYDKKTIPIRADQREKTTNTPSSVPLVSHANQGEKTEKLLALLHEAIQKQQVYPASALEMEREGRVTIGFFLLKNGTIQTLHLVKSSGTSVLDEAALTAVSHAAPFIEASHYLDQPQNYEIDVVFELTG